MIEDRRAILRADIHSLSVERGRVVRGKEDVEDVAERNVGRIEGNLQHLSMASGAGADLLVGRLGYAAAAVARFDPLHAAQLLEDCFQAPEAAASQRGLLFPRL